MGGFRAPLMVFHQSASLSLSYDINERLQSPLPRRPKILPISFSSPLSLYLVFAHSISFSHSVLESGSSNVQRVYQSVHPSQQRISFLCLSLSPHFLISLWKRKVFVFLLGRRIYLSFTFNLILKRNVVGPVMTS